MTSNMVADVRWSEAEKRLLFKSLQLYHKDFSRIQKAVGFYANLKVSFGLWGRVHVCLCVQVQTKSVSECVEFYYLWKKKKMNPSARGLSVNREACFNTQLSSQT